MNIDSHPIWITRYAKNGLWATLYSPKLKKSWEKAISILDDAVDVSTTKGADWKQIPRGLHAMLITVGEAYTKAELTFEMPTTSPRKWSSQQLVNQLQDTLDNVQSLLGKHESPKNSAHEQQQKMLKGKPPKARQHLEDWTKVLQDIRDMYVASKQISSDMEQASRIQFNYNPTLDRMLLAIQKKQEGNGNIAHVMKEFASLVREESFERDCTALRNLSECAWMIDVAHEYYDSYKGPDGGAHVIHHLRETTQFGKPACMGLHAVQMMFKELDPKHNYKFDITHDSCLFYMYLADDHNKLGQQLTRADIMRMEWVPPLEDPLNSINMPQIIFVRNTGNKMARFGSAVPGYNPGHGKENKSNHPSITRRGRLNVALSAKAKTKARKDEFDIERLLKSMKKKEEKVAKEQAAIKQSPQFGYAIAIKIVNPTDDEERRIRAMRIPIDTPPKDILRLSDTVYLLGMQSPRWARKLRAWSGKASFSPFIRLSEQELEDIVTQASGFIMVEDISSKAESMQAIKFKTKGNKKWLRTMLGDKGLKIFTDAARKPVTAFNL